MQVIIIITFVHQTTRLGIGLIAAEPHGSTAGATKGGTAKGGTSAQARILQDPAYSMQHLVLCAGARIHRMLYVQHVRYMACQGDRAWLRSIWLHCGASQCKAMAAVIAERTMARPQPGIPLWPHAINAAHLEHLIKRMM